MTFLLFFPTMFTVKSDEIFLPPLSLIIIVAKIRYPGCDCVVFVDSICCVIEGCAR